jgi:hypothetical protein
MTLTPEQKAAVASWIAAGDNLSAVQKKLGEQFKISLTYRDVRFLVDDLELELKDPAPKVDTTDVTKAPAAAPRTPPPATPEKKGMLDKLKEKVGLGSATNDPHADDEDELPAEEFPGEETMPDAPADVGGVTVELDRVVRPGFAMSGSVSFSDGVSGKWALDQYGRLMLDTGQPGYKPSAPDVQAFQRELSAQLQRHGF